MYPLVVIQYRITNHPRRTEHWSLAAVISAEEAQIYELMGDYSNFSYTTRLKDRYAQPEALRGACQIGEIPADKVEWLGNKLEEIAVTHNNPDFDSQTWVLDAVSLLKDSGEVTIYQGVDEKSIRTELMGEDDRWEVADDTLFERMFNESNL